MREHIQLVISDVSKMTQGKDFGVFAYRTWRMTDMSTKRDLILSGLGWGGLPTWMVLDDVKAGRLVAARSRALSGAALFAVCVSSCRHDAGPGRKLADRAIQGRVAEDVQDGACASWPPGFKVA